MRGAVVWFSPGEKGHPTIIAVNALAPYLLTALMKRPRRFVYLSSGMHRGGSSSLRDIDWSERRWNSSQASVSPAVIDNWWRQGMMGGAKAHYDGIKAFSETDFTEDLKTVGVPTLVMHGDDDQVVPIANSGVLSAKLLKHGTLRVYEGLSHGMCTTHPDVINRDLLAFVTGA